MIIETLATRLPGWLTNLFRIWLGRPRPDLRIMELKSTGGHDGAVSFSAHVANYGTQECRPEITATVGDRPVEARPERTDLLPNSGPVRVEITVPRPELGDLVPALNNAATLYGETLRLEVRSGKRKAKPMTWSEDLYDQVTDQARHEVQQRAWRRGHGQLTDADVRAEMQSELLERHENRGSDSGGH